MLLMSACRNYCGLGLKFIKPIRPAKNKEMLPKSKTAACFNNWIIFDLMLLSPGHPAICYVELVLRPAQPARWPGEKKDCGSENGAGKS
jgi:hypothetical protein